MRILEKKVLPKYLVIKLVLRVCLLLFLNLSGFRHLSYSQINTPVIPTISTYQPFNLHSQSNVGMPKASSVPTVISQEKNRLAESKKQVDFIQAEIAKMNSVQKGNDRKIAAFDTNHYNKDVHDYDIALGKLSALANNPNATLSEAFYITESVFGKPYLSKAEYDQIITKSVKFIKLWMSQNKLSLENNEDKHFAIQKFISAKLTVTEQIRSKDGKVTLKASSHLPYFYDYDDYQAEKDHRNFFVTKCLATGGGQCNSLPMVYLLLAEKFNAPAYLTFAPQHSFIKYPKNDGEIENYEVTSNWHINDLWYQEYLFISPEAIRSKIYLDTLSKKKIIGQCILELATQYTRKMPFGNGEFIQKCLKAAYVSYPKQNNINSYFLYSCYLKGLLFKYLNEKNINDINQIGNDEYALKLQMEYQKNEAYITDLGYTDLPEGAYEEMLNEHKFMGEIQKVNKLDGKQKRNLFVEVN